jgi:putative ABC transport system substrate-binding protein
MRHLRLPCSRTLSRRAVLSLGGATLFAARAAWPQIPGRTYRVGVLTAGPRDSAPFVAMLDGLRQFGFIEGQNLSIYWHRYSQIDLISKLAADLVKNNVDVIFANGDAGILAAQRATTTIPILGTTDDMVEAGLVKSLARPDGNTTGTSLLSADLDGKRQEILIESVPGVRRIAALADSNRSAGSRLQALKEAAQARNVGLSIHQIAEPKEIPTAIDAAKRSGAEALNILASPTFYGGRQIILQRVATLYLPTIYQFPEEAEEGGFVAYGPRVVQVFGEVMARQLAQLLRGVKPANIPVEQPTKFELVFNLKTAHALSLAVPQTLLVRADKVIE